MKAKVVGCTTFPNLRIKVFKVLSGDGVLEPLGGRYQLLSNMRPDFSLRVD